MMSGINALGPPRFHYRGLIIQASECLYTPLKLGLETHLCWRRVTNTSMVVHIVKPKGVKPYDSQEIWSFSLGRATLSGCEQ